MPTYSGNSKISKVFMGNTKIKKIFYGTDLVFSGGTAVSYYKGNTLLGTEEVDEGETALSPSSAITSKLNPGTDNFFAGWSLTDGGEVVKTLNGNDDIETINLYAVIIPKVLTIYSANVLYGDRTSLAEAHYTIWNKSYVDVTGFEYIDASTSWNQGPQPRHDVEWLKAQVDKLGIQAFAVWDHEQYTHSCGISVDSTVKFKVSLGNYTKAKIRIGAQTYTADKFETRFTANGEAINVNDGSINNNFNFPGMWCGITGNSNNGYVSVEREYTSDFEGELFTLVRGEHAGSYDTGFHGWSYGNTYIQSIELIME